MDHLKITIASLTLAAAFGMSVKAQEVSGYPVGYCNGEINTSSFVKHPTAGDWVSSAVYISPEYANTVRGNHIDRIKAGICSTIHVDSLKVWIRQDLEGNNLAEGAVAVDNLKKGWNTVGLKDPFQIPEDSGEGFYIGFSILQDGKSAGPAVLRGEGKGSFYLKLGDGAWEDRSAEGILCVEGMAYGDKLPKTNVELVSVSTAPKFIMSEGTLEAVAKVRNHGTLTVTGFDVKAEVEGAAEPCTATVECDIPFGEVREVKFVISPCLSSPVPPVRTALFTITGLKEGIDENLDDNTATASFDVVEKAFRRMAVVEEFTSERCPNCPAAAEKLHKMLCDPRYSDNVVAVCHHAGYHTDWLTIPSDTEYEWFYNAGGSTYAPAVMVDRMAAEGATSALFFPDTQAMMEEKIDERLAIPTPLSVKVSVAENADKTATVRVYGERLSEVPDGLVVTVFIVENDVAARNQAGSGNGYMHQHVNRAVNATWGEPIVWNGDSYSYECTLALKDIWNRRNMEAVAIVGRYTADDPLGCVVENAGHASFVQAGIIDAAAEGRTVAAYYDARGIRLKERPSEGFFITVYTDGTAEKCITTL